MAEVSPAVICNHELKGFADCTFMSPKQPSSPVRSVTCIIKYA